MEGTRRCFDSNYVTTSNEPCLSGLQKSKANIM